jgi:hypothetical protein
MRRVLCLTMLCAFDAVAAQERRTVDPASLAGCYSVRLGAWRPSDSVAVADSALLVPPRVIELTLSPSDGIAVRAFVVTARDESRSRKLGPSAWRMDGDSVSILLTDHHRGLVLRLHTTPEGFAGDALPLHLRASLQPAHATLRRAQCNITRPDDEP